MCSIKNCRSRAPGASYLVILIELGSKYSTLFFSERWKLKPRETKSPFQALVACPCVSSMFHFIQNKRE